MAHVPPTTGDSSSIAVLSRPPVSELEAKYYYAGLPSSPRLVARTSTTPWTAPTGMEAYRTLKELRVVGSHALKEVWEDNLALKLHDCLDSMKIEWTSTDVVRIGNVGESSAPIVIWIGVMPLSLSHRDGIIVASKCRELVLEHGISDVDVEIRESVVTRSAGPKLLASSYSSDTLAYVKEPITTSIGFPVSAQTTPWYEGTSGFFMTEGGNSEELLLITARHVVFIPREGNNTLFEDNESGNEHRYNVTIFGDVSFGKYLEFIQAEIRGKQVDAELQELRIRAVEGRDNPTANKERQKAQVELEEAREAMENLKIFFHDTSTRWASKESRILGHVILSPPISFGVGGDNDGYTEDWAVIRIDRSKVDASVFIGNFIDLGTQFSAKELTHLMRPNFKYPTNRLLPLKGTISDEEMREPSGRDDNNTPCLMVLKRGNTSGLTVGRATAFSRTSVASATMTSK